MTHEANDLSLHKGYTVKRDKIAAHLAGELDMSDFRKLTETFFASPQIGTDDIAQAASLGFATVINNRPDGEEPGQPEGDDIAQAVRAAGMEYVAIPIGQAGFGEAQIAAMTDALVRSEGKVLAFCRSGTRSTFLWSLAQAHHGLEPEEIAQAAAGAGYDISPIRAGLEMLAAKVRE